MKKKLPPPVQRLQAPIVIAFGSGSIARSQGENSVSIKGRAIRKAGERRTLGLMEEFVKSMGNLTPLPLKKSTIKIKYSARKKYILLTVSKDLER
jgi:hypothetical protein